MIFSLWESSFSAEPSQQFEESSEVLARVAKKLDLAMTEIKPARTSLYAQYLMQRTGQMLPPNGGGDFYMHREYAPGDELRKVDWKVFGRSDQLKVYQRRERETRPTTMLIDLEWASEQSFEKLLEDIYINALFTEKARTKLDILLVARGAQVLHLEDVTRRTDAGAFFSREEFEKAIYLAYERAKEIQIAEDRILGSSGFPATDLGRSGKLPIPNGNIVIAGVAEKNLSATQGYCLHLQAHGAVVCLLRKQN